MALPWIRLDTSFFDHPKVLNLIEDKAHRAVVAHLSGMAYTGKHGLDGYIPKAALRVIGATKTDAERLVTERLWEPAQGGWNVRDWDEYQVSDAETKARSEKARKAARKRWDAQ